MSGIEVAGLVLGGFPILVSAIEAYRRGLKPLKIWRHYRKHIVRFSNDVEIQQLFFENNLRDLLEPIVVSLNQLEVLLDAPGGPGWKTPELDAQLKSRLSRFYEPYMRTLTNMNDTLGQLQDHLGIVNGKVKVNDSTLLTRRALGILPSRGLIGMHS